MTKSDLIAYAVALPKAELQLQLEGTLEPEMMLSLAQRNKVDIPFTSSAAIRDAYQFSDQQSFAEIFQQSQRVLRTEEDFFDLTMAYLNRACGHKVRHAEIAFSPQAHITRGVSCNTVIGGILTAFSLAKIQFGMTTSLIMNFYSDRTQDDALAILHDAEPWLEQITGIRLDASDAGQPASEYSNLFKAAHERDLKRIVQFGANSTTAEMQIALEQLKVDRIDLANRLHDHTPLIERLISEQIPLSICPLSALKRNMIDDLTAHPLKQMLDRGMHVTLSSDAPAFFGGYMLDNFKAVIDALDLSFGAIKRLTKNSFAGSFLPEGQKRAQIAAIDLV